MKLLHFGGKTLLRQKGKNPQESGAVCGTVSVAMTMRIRWYGFRLWVWHDYLWVWNLFARLWLVVFCRYSGFLQPLCMSVDVNVHVSMHGRENNFVEMFYFVFKVNRSKSFFITEWTEISKFWIHCNIIITRICTSKEKTSKKKKKLGLSS